jgi:hypothetical protein
MWVGKPTRWTIKVASEGRAGLTGRKFPFGPTTDTRVNPSGVDRMSTTRPKYTQQAQQMATFLYSIRGTIFESVLPLNNTGLGVPRNCCFVIFGYYGGDWLANTHVELMRAVLPALDAVEYGFGVDEVEGRIWALLVGPTWATARTQVDFDVMKRQLEARLKEVVDWSRRAAKETARGLRKRWDNRLPSAVRGKQPSLLLSAAPGQHATTPPNLGDDLVVGSPPVAAVGSRSD